jgi:hypothetical protein
VVCERGVVVRSDGRCCAWWRLAFLGGLGVWAVLCCGSCLCAATSLMYEAVRGVVGRSSSAVRSAGFQPTEAEGLVVDDDASMSSSALWRRGPWALGRRLVLALVVGARVGGAGPRSHAGHRFAYAAHGRNGMASSFFAGVFFFFFFFLTQKKVKIYTNLLCEKAI